MSALKRLCQSSGPLGLVVHSRARSVTADLEICCGCQIRDWATMPRLLHTHALATLPAFGNLGSPRRPLFGNVANFWQPCLQRSNTAAKASGFAAATLNTVRAGWT